MISCTAILNMILYRGYNNCAALQYVHIAGLPSDHCHGNVYNITLYSAQFKSSKWSTQRPSCNNNLKAKSVPLHATKALGGGRGAISPLILDLGIRWGWVATVTPQPSFSPGKRMPGTHCTGGWWAPEPVWTEARGKFLSLLSEIEPRSPGPVRTDWATPAHYNNKHIHKYYHVRPNEIT
jgi:hypothetical protein